MNKNQNIYEWIGKKVVKVLLEFGILFMLLMIVYELAIASNQFINMFYPPDKGIWYWLITTLILAITYAIFLEKGMHERITAQIMNDMTISDSQKVNVAITSAIGAMIVAILSTHASYRVDIAMTMTVASFFLYFLVFYKTSAYCSRKNKQKKEARMVKDIVEKMYKEIKDIVPNLKPGDEIYYIKASAGHYRLTTNSKGQVYLVGNISQPAHELAKMIKEKLGISMIVEK